MAGYRIDYIVASRVVVMPTAGNWITTRCNQLLASFTVVSDRVFVLADIAHRRSPRRFASSLDG